MFKTKTINRGIILFSLVFSLASSNSFALTAKHDKNANVTPKQSAKVVARAVKQVETKVTPKKDIKNAKPKQSQMPAANTKAVKTENSALTRSVALELVKNNVLSEKSNNISPAVMRIKKANNKVKVTYKVFPEKNGKPESAAVFIGNKEVLKYTTSADGLAPEKRAKILADRLQYFINKNGNPNDIMPGMKNGIPICRANGEMLFTITQESAKAQKMPISSLTLKWINNIRQALGAPEIVRDYTHIASRSGILSSFSREIIGSSETGMASWYGGKFHGRRAADGSRFSTYDFTAAHKTLPFGSIVKVTNLGNGKFCYVRISDRGPFVGGRVIDLSKAAATHLNMLSSGIAKVKVETIKEF